MITLKDKEVKTMITFEGDKFGYETFSYIFENPTRILNMGRIHFLLSPVEIDYIEGLLFETEKEFLQGCDGKREPIITSMIIGSIWKIVFKDGTEIVNKDIKDCKMGEAIMPCDPHQINHMIRGF